MHEGRKLEEATKHGDFSKESKESKELFRIKPVADPRFGLDVFWHAWIWLQFFTKIGNENAQILRLLRAIAAPYGSEYGAVGHDFAAMRKKILDEVVLFRRQMHGFAAYLN